MPPNPFFFTLDMIQHWDKNYYSQCLAVFTKYDDQLAVISFLLKNCVTILKGVEYRDQNKEDLKKINLSISSCYEHINKLLKERDLSVR